MNTLKKTTLALVGLGAIVTTATTFADNNTTTLQSSTKTPMMRGEGNMHERAERGQFFKQYLRTDLSDTEKASLATLEKAHMEAVKALMDSTQSGSVTETDSKAQMKVLQDQFVTALLPYIATDKQDAFKQAMTTMPERHSEKMDREQGSDEQGKTRRGDDMNRGNDAPKTTSAVSANLLPANISVLIDTKLSTLSTSDAKLAWLNAINQKIDTLASKVTAQKSKNILAALKDLLNQKIDTINNVGVDSTLIDDILE